MLELSEFEFVMQGHAVTEQYLVGLYDDNERRRSLVLPSIQRTEAMGSVASFMYEWLPPFTGATIIGRCQ